MQRSRRPCLGERGWSSPSSATQGLHEAEVEGALRRGLRADHFLTTAQAFKTPGEVDALAAPYLGGDDPLFGFLAPLEMEAFLDPQKRDALRRRQIALDGIVVVYGTGATLCCEPDLLVYADMPRWEGQLRQRRGEVSNLGVHNPGLKGVAAIQTLLLHRLARLRPVEAGDLARWDFLLDTHGPRRPEAGHGRGPAGGFGTGRPRPFRVVPFFDPAPWGGQWMREVCGLDRDAPNYGWCFDCVPEENSLLLGFGGTALEIPSHNLVFHQPAPTAGRRRLRPVWARVPDPL